MGGVAALIKVISRLHFVGPWPFLIGLLVAALIFEPNFFQPNNLQDILKKASILGIVTTGQLLVMLIGGIDLSVGAMIGLTAVAIADPNSATAPGLAIGLGIMFLIAVTIGTVNGWLVTKRHVPPFVATFGMFVTLEGARLAYTRGSVSGTVPEGIRALGQDTLLGLPWSTLVWLLLLVAGSLFVARTGLGRRFMMVGANERMALLSGIPAARVKIFTFIACAVLAMLAGIFFSGFIGYVDRFIGRGADLDSITAALLGGTRFSGGHGSFIQVAGGVLLIAVLINFVVVSGLNVELQFIVEGLVLIGAVALQSLDFTRLEGASETQAT